MQHEEEQVDIAEGVEDWGCEGSREEGKGRGQRFLWELFDSESA